VSNVVAYFAIVLDYLTSTMHRVNLPPLQDRYSGKDRMTRERYSIPYFVSPDHDAIVECIPTCCDEKNPAKYGPTLWGEYLQMRASAAFGTN
jgi:isopenicillin N synthase-like dioxygenase